MERDRRTLRAFQWQIGDHKRIEGRSPQLVDPPIARRIVESSRDGQSATAHWTIGMEEGNREGGRDGKGN